MALSASDGRSIRRFVEGLVGPVARRARSIVRRAVVAGGKSTTKLRTIQVKLMEGDDDEVEHFEPYGLSGAATSGEAVVLAVGGSTDHRVAVVVSDRGGGRPTDLAADEVALYSKHGQVIYLRADGNVYVKPNAGGEVHLAGEPAADFVALAAKVEAELDKLHLHATTHTHGTSMGPTTTATSPPASRGATGAQSVKGT